MDRFLKISLLVAITLTVSAQGVFSTAATPPTYLGAPVIPYAKEIHEGRYETKMDFISAKKWFQKQFRGMSNITLKKLVNQPGVKAIHFKNSNSKNKWEGINLYQINRVVRLYIIPRENADESRKEGKEKAKPDKKAKKDKN